MARVRNLLSSPYPRAALVLVVVLALDQLSKQIVAHDIPVGEQVKFLPGIQFVHTRNHGVAFGLAAGDQLLVTSFIVAALIALLAYFVTHSSRPLLWLPTGLLLGGALGNLADRIRSGSVVDFVQLPLGWPPFNLADVSIVAGVALFLIVVADRRPPAPDGPRDPDEPHGQPEPDGPPLIVVADRRPPAPDGLRDPDEPDGQPKPDGPPRSDRQ